MPERQFDVIILQYVLGYPCRQAADIMGITAATARTHRRLACIADVPSDADGALYFACLLNFAQESDSVLWWWQFAAGAGNATAAYCLHLHHLLRGELRDADHRAHQAFNLDTDVHLIPTTTPTPIHCLTHFAPALREAVERLKVEELAQAPFHHADHRLADQVEHLADAR
ncbi:sigma-70 region 4 domain-containing protein [Streptomyces sp. NPDC055793]